MPPFHRILWKKVEQFLRNSAKKTSKLTNPLTPTKYNFLDGGNHAYSDACVYVRSLFTAESAGERISEIGQYLAKLWTTTIFEAAVD